MNNEKYKVTWLFKPKIGADLLELAKGGSVNQLVSDLLEAGIENKKRISENLYLDKEIAELKGIEIISGCITISHLKSASTYISLYNMGFGSSQVLNKAYEAKKELLIN